MTEITLTLAVPVAQRRLATLLEELAPIVTVRQCIFMFHQTLLRLKGGLSLSSLRYQRALRRAKGGGGALNHTHPGVDFVRAHCRKASAG